MLLTMALMIAIASIALELMLTKKDSPLRKITRIGTIPTIILSVALSWVIGWLFAAAGVVILMGALISTVVTEPIHAFRRKVEERNNAISEWWTAFKNTYMPLFKAIKYTLLLLTLPIWIGPYFNKKKNSSPTNNVSQMTPPPPPPPPPVDNTSPYYTAA